MRIKEISWSNYRNLPDGTISARRHVVLIGANDTGKSSLLRGLHLCLGMAHAQVLATISERDFTDPTRPMKFTVKLHEINDDDRAAFPDEISVGPPEELVLELETTVDPSDPDQKSVRRSFPDSGHSRGPSRAQLDAIGFEYIPAVRSLLRELGGTSSGVVRSLLSTIDLSADEAALRSVADEYRRVLDSSHALGEFRTELASALTSALPNPVLESDVRVVTEAEALDDHLSGVTVTVRDGAHDAPLAEQSDGIRALSLLTLLGMSHKSAKIVAIDEPETHLHPTGQRTVARAFRRGRAQAVLVTHSPSVVSQMDPLDIVTMRADRTALQLPASASIARQERTVRYWSHRLIEPLTSRHVIVVEGVSDRIMVERAAELLSINLDQLGITIFELDGSDQFNIAHRLIGSPGFNMHLVGLLDEDARNAWAAELGVAAASIEEAGYIVCNPDLEGVYVDALGVANVVRMLVASALVSERSLLDSCGKRSLAEMTRDDLWTYCRHKKHKVSAALAVSADLDVTAARSLRPLTRLLELVS